MKIKLAILGLVFSLTALLSTHAQILDPVKWEYRYEWIGENEIELIFTAVIETDWHLYSQNIPEGGPIPTSFKIEDSDSYELVGSVNEVTEPEEKYDPSFDMMLKLFSNKAIFKQRIKVLSSTGVQVNGFVEFMSCDDERCLPPKEDDFIFRILAAGESEDIAGTEETESEKEAVGFEGLVDLSAEETIDTSGKDIPSGRSMWGFFLFSMLAGFAGILTPCVFPMIPMTVAFFSRESENRLKAIGKAMIFGLSIILIYTSVGLIVSLTSAGADFASNLSTHWIPNLIFFILFMIFAASFLGMFELVLPGRLVNSADKQADKGGYLASFFLGLTTVLVSFSCTGPIVGALLVEAASGEIVKPTVGMFGFAVAFSLPFTLFAIFPSWLSNLPKSGGWLNSVKVVLGFIVLAFGMKFLSNMDQTYHLGIMSRDLYLAIWIVIFTIMGFYLLGKIKFAHDSDLPFIKVPRLIMIIATFSFVLYLIPGLFGAPLKAISGLIPPQDKQLFNLPALIGESGAVSSTDRTGENRTLCEKPKYGDFLHLPYGLEGYFDYEQGLECARMLDKPILLDFKGHACSNCKEMEGKVWSDPEVLKILKNDYLIIALYVDDRTKLPEEEWIVSGYDGKVKKTIGKKYADFQISRFNVNTQPFYVLVDHNGDILAPPRGYDLNVQEYIQFLEDGITEFRKE
ncbi:MAG: thioredoxin family protein [Bacteroidales bacterium]|nr:MAG: thioredoxin family protein [Bacteroidales bacterium]